MIARGEILINPASFIYTTAGSLKRVHGVTLHAALVLPALVLPALVLVLTHRGWDEQRRIRAVTAAIGLYALATIAILAISIAFSGRAILGTMPIGRSHRRPDMTTVHLVGGIEKRGLVMADYDPRWPEKYTTHERRIYAALGSAAIQVDHIGSTSVPGLAAKPIIDIQVIVEDITAEEVYLDQLLRSGYELRVREPAHRMVRTPERDVHVHIHEVGYQAADDHLLFRDHLRSDPADRDLYECTKRALISQDWPDMNAYAEAKTEVIVEINARARKSSKRTPDQPGR